MQFDSFYSEIAFWLLHHVSNHFLVELDHRELKLDEAIGDFAEPL